MGDEKEDDAAKYGYEDPDSKYGYEDPDEAASIRNRPALRTARRSSMKQEGGAGVPTRRRRASIQFVGEIEVHLPGESEPVKRRTSIDFCDTPTVEESPSLRGDSKTMWIQPTDYDAISKNNAKIVKHVERGTKKNFCLRGLEGMMAKSKHKKNRATAKAAVIEEQTNQRQEGVFDAGRISESYRMMALQSKLEAAERAETDNAEVQAYVGQARKIWKRRSTRRLSC
jgi:hypothetical protein